VYFLADSGQSATRVGLASAVAPGAASTLWLTSYPAGADPRTAAGVAREVSRAGRPSGPQVTLPAGYLIERGTSRGLLLAPVARGSGTTADELWDPAAARPGRTLARVIAASATEVAWVPPCVTRCRLQVLNLATGRPETVGLPAASSVANAAFSPDGSLLAVELSFSNNSAGFGWAAGPDSLVAELGFTTKVQLASWRPGASRLAIVALSPQHSPASLVIGQDAR
jgi:hypothetical protein